MFKLMNNAWSGLIVFFSDGDYLKFLDSLDHPDSDEVVSIDTYLEELEAKERDAKGIRGTFIMQGK